MKPKEQKISKDLRKNGMSIKNIAKILNVSSGSVTRWTKDIQLTEEQICTLYSRPGAHHIAQIRKEKARKDREKYQEEGRIKAKELDYLHMAGCMLYWAEGDKDRTRLGFSNSDINMISFFLRFLREQFCVSDDDITIRINCFTNNGLFLLDIENYWLLQLDLPRNCLKRSIVNVVSKSSKRKRNTLPYGTCHLRVLKSVKTLQHIYGATQEYGCFENERWLL